MQSLDPVLESVLSALVTGMEALDVRYCLIGALVPELLLDEPPPRRTNDADAVVLVPTLAEFERVKVGLADYGFRPTKVAHRLEHKNGGRLDLLPYSPQLAPEGKVVVPPDVTLTVTGFDHIAGAALLLRLKSDGVLPVVPLPLYALLKLVAFADRGLAKDPAGVTWLLYHYADNDERRFGLEHGDGFVPFEMTTAYLAGLDARPYLSDELRRAVRAVLEQLLGDAASLDSVADELGWRTVEGDHLHSIDDALRWFKAGLGV